MHEDFTMAFDRGLDALLLLNQFAFVRLFYFISSGVFTWFWSN